MMILGPLAFCYWPFAFCLDFVDDLDFWAKGMGYSYGFLGA